MHALLSTISKLGINNFVLVDVGAKGSLATIAGIEKISEIHAFEPHPDEFKLLEKKYLNHPFKKLCLNCLGLSESSGKSSFMLSNNSSMSSLLEPDLINYKKHFGNYKAYQNWASSIDTEKTIDITIDTLDHYFKEAITIDYIKIDTQGSELMILNGAQKLLETGRIKVLKVEVSTVATYQGQALFSDIDIFLRKHNYCLVDFLTYREHPSYLLGEDQEIHFAPCGDAIYCYVPHSSVETENIKKAMLINHLGYASLALTILESTSLNKLQIDELIQNSSNSNLNIWKKIAKDLIPPLFIKLFKKSLF